MSKLFSLATLGLFLFLLGCAGGNPVNDAAPTFEAEPTSLTIVTSEPVPAASSFVPPGTPLIGPVIGFYIEDTNEEVFLSIFDTGTGAFRLFQNGPVIGPHEAQWFGNGCFVYTHGQLLDLQGMPVWSVPGEAAAEIADFHGSQLAPGRDWLAYLVHSGEMTATGAELLDIATVRLSPPFERFRLTERGGGDPAALLWTPDGEWVYFSDFDDAGLLQIYRARPDGQAREQLTAHTEAFGDINVLSLSPDGRQLAYGTRNLLLPQLPYEYDSADEGWIGIVNLDTTTARRIHLPQFGATESGRGLIWNASGDRLLVIGDSLPVPAEEPLTGRQIHWLTADGLVERSLYQAEAPNAQVGWVTALRDIDTLLFSSNADTYRYENEGVRKLEGTEAPPIGLDIGRRPIGVLPAAVGFPGEEACEQ